MAVLAELRSGRWRPVAVVLATTMGATILLWSLSRMMERPAEWSPPSGARIALFVHLFTVIPAVALGAFVLWRPKGDARHKLMGRVWAMLMMVTAISSFWLQTLRGGLSLIHLFSVLTLVSIPLAIRQVRRGNIRAHLRAMRGVYIGTIVAGLLAAVPGRYLGDLLFG